MKDMIEMKEVKLFVKLAIFISVCQTALGIMGWLI